jgi:hypothetical protein
MTHAYLSHAIAGASPAHLDALARELWSHHGAGRINDEEAQALAEAIQARRQARAPDRPAGVSLGAVIERRSIFPPKRPQKSPDWVKSRERRRTIARSNPLPPALLARFTDGEAAVLGVVGDEIAERGVCGLSVGEIAARAGVCHRLAQAALRLAEGMGLVSITARPRKGQKHQTNLVRVLSREWASWLAKRRRIGCKAYRPTEIEGIQGRDSRPNGTAASRSAHRGGSDLYRTRRGVG